VSKRKAGTLKIAIVAVTLAAALLALGYGVYRVYKKWMPRHLATEARALAEKGDMQNAVLAARRAYQINPNSVAACRLIADLAEKLNEPEAVQFRRRVIAMEPDSIDDVLACAATAFRFNQPEIAEQALATVKDPAKKNARYFSSAGMAAVALRKFDDAAKYYAEAARLEPSNDMHQFNDTTARLQSKDAAQQKAARATLERLRASKTVRVFAHRTLLAVLLANNEMQNALACARELQAYPDAAFADRITYLDLLRQTNSAEWPAFLKELQGAAAENPESAGRIAAWMDTHGMAAQAVEWGRTLKLEVVANGAAGIGLAPCYLAARDWAGLQALVKDTNWGQFDYLRLAYLARALREQGDKNGFLAQWNLATTAAGKRAKGALDLAQIAAAWGWVDEVPDLLWKVSADSADAKWALARLYKHYTARSDTRGLWRVTARLIEIMPDDDVAKNNFAMYSLLLKNDVARADVIAHELYAKDPANPIFVSTYAFSLHRQGRSDEALQIMNSLKREQLEEPSTAAYYGVVLAAAGAPDAAREFLDLAENAKLLPEEKDLVTLARQPRN
jgi:hypothetical protein